jgi:beta-glucosidase
LNISLRHDGWAEKVPAILYSWYGGTEGCNALCRVLFGDVNPSGKLPFTIPLSADQLPYFSSTDREISYDLYHGYTLADKKGYQPSFPFGFGLSYTTFQYSNLRLTAKEIPTEGDLYVSVDVSNTGSCSGEEVVQLYIGFPSANVDRPIKLLRDFVKNPTLSR